MLPLDPVGTRSTASLTSPTVFVEPKPGNAKTRSPRGFQRSFLREKSATRLEVGRSGIRPYPVQGEEKRGSVNFH